MSEEGVVLAEDQDELEYYLGHPVTPIRLTLAFLYTVFELIVLSLFIFLPLDDLLYYLLPNDVPSRKFLFGVYTLIVFITSFLYMWRYIREVAILAPDRCCYCLSKRYSYPKAKSPLGDAVNITLLFFLTFNFLITVASIGWSIYTLKTDNYVKVDNDSQGGNRLITLPSFYIQILIIFINCLLLRHLIIKLATLRRLNDRVSFFIKRSAKLINNQDFINQEKRYLLTVSSAYSSHEPNSAISSPKNSITEEGYGTMKTSTPPTAYSTLRGTNSFVKFLETPPTWKDSKECKRCNSEFSVSTPRCHCRNCGESFCDACSSYQTPIEKFGWSKPVRVCVNCYIAIISF